MYAVSLSGRYKRSFKRLLKSGKKTDIQKLEEVVGAIASGNKLHEKHKNHYLSGNLSEYQECHVKDDLLLIYYKNETNLILVLVDVGSHSELFN